MIVTLNWFILQPTRQILIQLNLCSTMRYDLWELTNENIELAALTAAVDYFTSDNMMDFFRYNSVTSMSRFVFCRLFSSRDLELI